MSHTTRIDICPMCETSPRVTGFFRFQVKCRCGTCGPKMRSTKEAIGRWNSVARFVDELRGTDWLGDCASGEAVAATC